MHYRSYTIQVIHYTGHTRQALVGGGLVRPEVCTFVNSGRITSINAERGNLGTNKSVPYEKPTNTLQGCESS
ncbi:MAG: hypothetical protein FWG87_09510 [Defluviitaleaceae bacterium]|nr:hypothetical protein [Defluviitaleaceae bacterium]